MNLTKQARRTILICVALSAATLAVFWPVTGCDFTNYDDPIYVSGNPHVQSGLTRESVQWAFTTGYAGNWHPLTWLSHMLDCQLYRRKSGGHHLTSLLFHIANSLLLFGLLRRLTDAGQGRRKEECSAQNWGAFWRCCFVAALFALHPLHVESVAWVAERKDVLSTFFFMLTLWAYARYAEVQGPTSKVQSQGTGDETENAESGITDHGSRITDHVTRYYLLSLLFFALGLMSKPMLVTLPFVLLLLDYWPLQRCQPAPCDLKPSARKLHPSFFILHPLLLEKLPFLALSAASCVVTFLVQRGAGAVPSLEALPLGFRLSNALISYVRYALKMGWPAKLAVFYPAPVEWPPEWVAGAALVLAGVSALALRSARKAPWFAFGWFWYLLTLVPVIGIVQVGHQAMADRYSYIPLVGLFVTIAWGGAEAGARWPKSRGWLAAGAAAALAACGALTWQQTGYWRNSASLFEHALAVTRDNFVAHNNLGEVLMDGGDLAAAESHFAEAVRLKPYDAEARCSLAAALTSQHKAREAIQHYQEALKLLPNFPDALNNLAWILAANPDPQVRNGPEAVGLAERACKLTNYKQPLLVGTLAAAYAEAGRFTEAVATAEKARTLAEQANQLDVAARNRALLELYRSGQPARDTL